MQANIDERTMCCRRRRSSIRGKRVSRYTVDRGWSDRRWVGSSELKNSRLHVSFWQIYWPWQNKLWHCDPSPSNWLFSKLQQIGMSEEVSRWLSNSTDLIVAFPKLSFPLKKREIKLNWIMHTICLTSSPSHVWFCQSQSNWNHRKINL